MFILFSNKVAYDILYTMVQTLSKTCVCVYTLFGAAVIGAWSRVRCILGVPRGSTVAGPVELVGLVLREQTQGLVLEATLELPWTCANTHTQTHTDTYRPRSNAVEFLISRCVMNGDLLRWGLTGAVKVKKQRR